MESEVRQLADLIKLQARLVGIGVYNKGYRLLRHCPGSRRTMLSNQDSFALQCATLLKALQSDNVERVIWEIFFCI